MLTKDIHGPLVIRRRLTTPGQSGGRRKRIKVVLMHIITIISTQRLANRLVQMLRCLSQFLGLFTDTLPLRPSQTSPPWSCHWRRIWCRLFFGFSTWRSLTWCSFRNAEFLLWISRNKTVLTFRGCRHKTFVSHNHGRNHWGNHLCIRTSRHNRILCQSPVDWKRLRPLNFWQQNSPQYGYFFMLKCCIILTLHRGLVS